jgi:hypothetical protein
VDKDVDAERRFLRIGDRERAGEGQPPDGGGALFAEPADRLDQIGWVATPRNPRASHRITLGIGRCDHQRGEAKERDGDEPPVHDDGQVRSWRSGVPSRGGREKSKAPASGDA